MSKRVIESKGKLEERVAYFLDNSNALHREDGPAVEYVNVDYKAWYINGKRHREDGPAIENRVSEDDTSITFFYDYGCYYFLNGIRYSEKDYWAIIKLGAFI